MPFVPTQRQGQLSLVDPQQKPEPKFLAMAAAMMHEQGRLFEPPPEIEIGSSSKVKGPDGN